MGVSDGRSADASFHHDAVHHLNVSLGQLIKPPSTYAWFDVPGEGSLVVIEGALLHLVLNNGIKVVLDELRYCLL